MDVPGIVRERLADERRMTSVNVGGDDRVYVTPPKTLVYRAAGLFSSESIEEFPHDVARFDVSADRREATFAFEYETGVEAFSAPRERIETVLPPVLAGVLRTTGRIAEDERIEESYRFGERTLVVTDRQLLTSVGEAVWDREHDSYDYEQVTDLSFEDDLRIDVDGRPRYIELSGEGRREAYETLESALCAYHGVASIDQLPDHTPERTTDAAPVDSEARTVVTDPTGDSSGGETTDSDADQAPATEPAVGDPAGPDTGTADPEGGEQATAESRSVPAESSDPLIPEATESESTADSSAHDEREAVDRKRLAEEVDALGERVERQTELLERQTELLERLVEEASTGRVNDDR